jgi:hypothetical protein
MGEPNFSLTGSQVKGIPTDNLQVWINLMVNFVAISHGDKFALLARS